MKGTFRRLTAVMITLTMLLSVVPAFAASDNGAGSMETKFNYVALGDASAQGYGMTEDEEIPFTKVVEGTYPALIRDAVKKNGFNVKLDNLAIGGMRIEEVRYLLDDNYIIYTECDPEGHFCLRLFCHRKGHYVGNKLSCSHNRPHHR